MSVLWIPADRLLPILELSDSRERTETERRLIEDLRNGRQEFVTLPRADRILTRLGLDDYWHYTREDGGLADIYEDGAQYGVPNHVTVNRLPRPQRRKYATEQERHQARLETQRRSYRRRRYGEAA